MELKTSKQEIIKWLMLRKDFELTVFDYGDWIIISLYTVGEKIKIENIYSKKEEAAKKEIDYKIAEVVKNAKNK